MTEVGIKIRGTHDSIIELNNVTLTDAYKHSDTVRGISSYSLDRMDDNVTIRNNTVTGNGASSDCDCISFDAFEVGSPTSTNMIVTNNTIESCNYGVDLATGNNGDTVTNNTISHHTTCINDDGIGNTVTGNTKTDCSDA